MRAACSAKLKANHVGTGRHIGPQQESLRFVIQNSLVPRNRSVVGDLLGDFLWPQADPALSQKTFGLMGLDFSVRNSVVCCEHQNTFEFTGMGRESCANFDVS
jgi:hypothetical protein